MPQTDSQKGAVEAPVQHGALDLYEDQLQAYHEALDRGLDCAGRRFGFVLYHSLPGSEVVELRKQMGFKPIEATDFYNLGVVHAEKEEYAEAIKMFQKALELDSDLAEAEFNLALAFELSGDVTAAKKTWSLYMKRETTNESDRTEVAEHLKELG